MFLILCSYVYLTCLPGFPTRFTDKDRCSNSLRIVYEYCAKTMGQSFNPDDLFTYSEEQVCVYPPHLDVHDLAVMACRWTEGCWFFVVKNKKTCGLSLKNMWFTSCLHPFFWSTPFAECRPSPSKHFRLPRQSRRVVTEMKYPSPVGFVTVTAKEVNDYWGDVKLEEILDPVAWWSYGDLWGPLGTLTCWKMKSAGFTQICLGFYVVLRWVNIL